MSKLMTKPKEKKDAKGGEKEEAMETEGKKGDDQTGEYGEWASRCTLVKPGNLVDERSSEEISRSHTTQKLHKNLQITGAIYL